MNSQLENVPVGGREDGRKSSFNWRIVLMVVVLFAIAAAGVLRIRANRLPSMTKEAYTSASDLWNSRQPANYEITVEVTGMQPGIYEVVVENGLAVEASFDGRPLTRRRTFGTWAVAGMFDTLSSDLETNERENYLMLGAVFDPDFGYPVRYQRIEMRTGAHDTLQWQVTRFEPRQ